MIEGKLLYSDDELSEVYQIQKTVFGNSIHNIEPDDENLFTIHAIVYESGEEKKAVAAGSLNYNGEVCRLDRVAVLKENRGNYYGDFIVKILLNKAFMSEIKKVDITVEPNNIGFFKKIGFQAEYEHGESIRMSITSAQVAVKCQKNKKFIGN